MSNFVLEWSLKEILIAQLWRPSPDTVLTTKLNSFIIYYRYLLSNVNTYSLISVHFENGRRVLV